ncbi:MAG: 2-oxoadipate dioxygenase/decarboxylase family protein [Gammaproteobacteria bacterium]
MLTSSQLRERFVAAATARFETQVPDFARLRALIRAHGGRVHNDHGAVRSADPQRCRLLVEAAGVMGLYPEREYRFPAKKLRSFDLQVPGEDAGQFKIFVSEVDLDAFPAAVAAQIRADCAAQAAAVDLAPLRELIQRAQSAGGLQADEAERFIQYLLERLMRRHGPPLKRSTVEAVAAVSGEAASALALGPDFNHLTLDVQAAGYASIEDMDAALRAAGFQMLPAIQGEPGACLRQTATRAASVPTPVLEADGRLGSAATEQQFVEIIERGWVNDAQGRRLRFKHFLTGNAERIFDAASTRSARRQPP